MFDQNGKFLTVWPTKLIGVAFFYVDDDDTVYVPEHNAGMISILTLDGERLATWGGMIHRSCHGIWCDSHHDLYVVQPGEWEPRARRVVKYTGSSAGCIVPCVLRDASCGRSSRMTSYY